ncbi:MAG: molybdopterin-dependent oxidoreductase [Amaricoccus sp.]
MRHRSVTAIAAIFVLAPSLALAQARPALLSGAVKAPITLDEADMTALPAVTIDISFETSGGTETGTYTGALLWDLLAKAELVNDPGKNASLKHAIMVTGRDGYAVAIALGEIDPKFGAKQVLVAYRGSDPSVSFDSLRVLVPGDLHGGRSVKDVASIEVR